MTGHLEMSGQNTANSSAPINDALNQASDDVFSAVGTCPFSGLEVGIIPVRYALDEIREDNGKTRPQGKNPLPDNGLWQPPLQLDAPYTLRQLRDGWIYVYSEQGKTFHEYKVAGPQFIKYDWSEADVGQDERGQPGESKSCLVYPAHHVLYIAFSHQRWSWRVCEHMRSNINSRNNTMRRVPLPAARRCEDLTHIAQSTELGSLVADIDAASDTEFDLSCTPLSDTDQQDSEDSEDSMVAAKPATSAPAYTQDLPDTHSGLLVALDDPLADVCDLYLQLTPEWMSFQEMQEEHKLQMINTTEQMALPFIEEASLPAHLQENTAERLRFKQQLMEHVANWQAYHEHHGSDHTEMVMRRLKAERLQQTEQVLTAQGFEPDNAKLTEWIELLRYQDDIDWPALYGYLAQFEQRLQRAQYQLVRCHRDLRQGCEQLGAEPWRLGLDNQQKQGQHYLHSLFHDILPILTLTSVNEALTNELAALLTARDPQTLLALAPYGFDRAVYDAVSQETVDNPLFSPGNSSDATALASRLADWDTIKGDSVLRDSAWYRALAAPVQAVLGALSDFVTAGAAQLRNQMLSAILPQTWTGGPVAGLRLMLMEAIVDPRLQFKASPQFAAELQRFESDHLLITKKIHEANQAHNQQGTSRHRSRTLARLRQQLEQLLGRVPQLIKLNAESLNAAGRDAIADYLSRAGEAIRRGSNTTLRGLNNIIPNLGTVGGGVALVNMWNLQQVLANLTDNAEQNGAWYATRELGFTVSWTGNAIAALYQGNVWNNLAKNHSGLLKRSLKDAADLNGAVTRSFIKTMGWMSGLGLVAAGLEGWHSYLIFKDPNSVISDVERNLYRAKSAVLAVQSGIFAAQLLFMAGNMSIGFIFAPWMITGMFVLGVMYLGISLLLNKYQQTGLEKWLRQSTWGVQKQNWNEQEELFRLEQQIYQPGGKVTENNGYQLELALPKYLRQQSIGLEVVLTPEQPSGPGPQRTINCNIQQGRVFDEGNYLRYQLALPGMRSKWFNTLVRITFAASQGQQQHAFILSARGLDSLSTKIAESLSVNTNLTLETEAI